MSHHLTSHHPPDQLPDYATTHIAPAGMGLVKSECVTWGLWEPAFPTPWPRPTRRYPTDWRPEPIWF